MKCENCKTTIKPVPKKYCGEACKQKAYRARKKRKARDLKAPKFNKMPKTIATALFVISVVLGSSLSAAADGSPTRESVGGRIAWEGSASYFNALVDAIYQAEGGSRARKPFGILSVPCEGYEDCRQICLNTVRNNWDRWQRKTHNADQYPNYLSFLASRYAPVGADNDPTNLNRYWLKNVRALLYGQLTGDKELGL